VPISQIVQYGEKLALNLLFGQATLGAAPTIYIACLTADPAATVLNMTGVTEYAATGYARQLFGASGGASAASPSVIQNAGTITFGPFTAGTGAAVTTIAICDSASGAGNLIAACTLAASRTPAVGDSLVGAAGAFTFSW
jgi:hypothetical protein